MVELLKHIINTTTCNQEAAKTATGKLEEILIVVKSIIMKSGVASADGEGVDAAGDKAGESKRMESQCSTVTEESAKVKMFYLLFSATIFWPEMMRKLNYGNAADLIISNESMDTVLQELEDEYELASSSGQEGEEEEEWIVFSVLDAFTIDYTKNVGSFFGKPVRKTLRVFVLLLLLLITGLTCFCCSLKGIIPSIYSLMAILALPLLIEGLLDFNVTLLRRIIFSFNFCYCFYQSTLFGITGIVLVREAEGAVFHQIGFVMVFLTCIIAFLMDAAPPRGRNIMVLSSLSFGLMLMIYFYCSLHYKWTDYADYYIPLFGENKISVAALHGSAIQALGTFFIRFISNAAINPNSFVMITSRRATKMVKKSTKKILEHMENLEGLDNVKKFLHPAGGDAATIEGGEGRKRGERRNNNNRRVIPLNYPTTDVITTGDVIDGRERERERVREIERE